MTVWRRTKERVTEFIQAQLDRLSLSSDTSLLAICKHFETFAPNWYLCPTGHRTIGYGHTGPSSDLSPAPWTEAYALKVLSYELRGPYRNEAVQALLKCGLRFEEDFLPHQQLAILSLVHNEGPNAIWIAKEGRPATWVRRWKNGASRTEIEEAWYRWNKGEVNGRLVVLPGLVRRRHCEMRLFWDNVVDFYPAGWQAYYEGVRG